MSQNKLPFSRFLEPSSEKLIYLLSHGLRSPFTALRWGLEALQNGRFGMLNPSQSDHIAKMQDKCVDATIIMKAMFLLTRIENKSVVIKKQSVDACCILQETAEKLSSQRQGEKIKLNIACSTTLLMQDPALLRNFFVIMLSACTNETGNTPTIDVQMDSKATEVKIHIVADIALPQLQHTALTGREEANHCFIGGTPGLLFHLGQSIANSMGIRVKICEDQNHKTAIAISIPSESS